MDQEQRTRVGVGVMILKDGKVLLAKRKGSHGNGEFAFPGGHLEYMESFENCARREVKEECGIEIDNIRFQFFANVTAYAPKHYIHVALVAEWKSGEPMNLEPDKSEPWQWYDLDHMPMPMFAMCTLALESYRNGKQYFDIADLQCSIIQSVADEVKERLANEGSGHDWWHVERVWKMAKRIGQEERADVFVVELAALLHDIADWKFHGGDESVGPRAAREVMSAHGVSEEGMAHVCDIIATMSYKGAGVPTPMRTPEGKCVQDADRLDALGAIGIGRVFVYSGHKGRLMHVPDAAPVLHQSKEAYFHNENTAINHFYEKLLLLKDRMNTETAKKIADGRHRFMEEYLERFYKEWEGSV